MGRRKTFEKGKGRKGELERRRSGDFDPERIE